MEAKDTMIPRLRGELENFAKDTVEYYQKTGLVFPDTFETTVNRIAEISFKTGKREVVELLPKIPERFDHNKTCFDCVENIKRQLNEMGTE